jgi:hypothetical protein
MTESNETESNAEYTSKYYKNTKNYFGKYVMKFKTNHNLLIINYSKEITASREAAIRKACKRGEPYDVCPEGVDGYTLDFLKYNPNDPYKDLPILDGYRELCLFDVNMVDLVETYENEIPRFNWEINKVPCMQKREKEKCDRLIDLGGDWYGIEYDATEHANGVVTQVALIAENDDNLKNEKSFFGKIKPYKKYEGQPPNVINTNLLYVFTLKGENNDITKDTKCIGELKIEYYPNHNVFKYYLIILLNDDFEWAYEEGNKDSFMPKNGEQINVFITCINNLNIIKSFEMYNDNDELMQWWGAKNFINYGPRGFEYGRKDGFLFEKKTIMFGDTNINDEHQFEFPQKVEEHTALTSHSKTPQHRPPKTQPQSSLSRPPSSLSQPSSSLSQPSSSLFSSPPKTLYRPDTADKIFLLAEAKKEFGLGGGRKKTRRRRKQAPKKKSKRVNKKGLKKTRRRPKRSLPLRTRRARKAAL